MLVLSFLQCIVTLKKFLIPVVIAFSAGNCSYVEGDSNLSVRLSD